MTRDTERHDVVIPVYNAVAHACRCIDSLYASVPDRIARVIVEDDASGTPTREGLAALEHPRLRVHSVPRNTGFARSVNRGLTRTRSEFVLVLNSDVVLSDDFVSPLAEALRRDPSLAAVSPRDGRGRDLSDYERESGYVRSYGLWAHAFLVRRSAFFQVGGFDGSFGRGYFEDLDLSRKWTARGWRIGVHPHAAVEHAGHGSFSALPETTALRAANRKRYFQRYPDARRRVLLVTPRSASLNLDARARVRGVLAEGGRIDWVGGGHGSIPAWPMRRLRFGWGGAARKLSARACGSRGHYTDVWIDDEKRASGIDRAARRAGLASMRGRFTEPG